jgi:glycogen(starch) synthase
MIERLLVDEALRDRLVTEASEYVLRFDWEDVAGRTRGIYDALHKLVPREEARRG